MSNLRNKVDPREWMRYLFPVILTVFLIAQSNLGNASQLQSTQEPYQPTQPPHDQGSVSCGKLVFLEDLNTGAKLIGLRDCSGGDIYIFGQRPAELFNYYEFYGVKIARGDDINDSQYGRLNKYIVAFSNYRMIPDCSYCGRNFEPPTATLASVPPTETAAVVAPVATEEVASTELAESPAAPEGSLVTTECISNTAEIVAQAMGFPKYQFLIDQAPDMLEEAPGEEVCGTDPTCLQTVQLKTLVAGMVEASFEASPGPRPVGQIMGAIATLMDSSEMDTSCSLQGVMGVEMAKQFSIKGMAINSYAMHSPADFRVRDFENKDSGFFKSGEVKQDIPLSVTRREGESEYVFVPSSSVAAVEFEGNSEGAMTFEAVRNAGTVVQEIGYDQVPVDAQTKGNLNTTAGTQPKLEITASSSGQLASLDPTRYQEFAIVASVAPVTATPTLTSTPTVTATPEGFQLPGDSQLWVGLILIACVGAFLALVVIGLVYMFFVRGRTK